MILEIVTLGDPVLRKKAAPVAEVTPETKALIDNMIETMHAAHGVGLAAPQVGISLQLAVVDVSHDPTCVSFLRLNGNDVPLQSIMPLVFLNPEIEPTGMAGSESEGCLSIPNVRAAVIRPLAIKTRMQTPDGSSIELECDGLLARAIQHETDHLNGILFIDRLGSATKLRLRRQLKPMLTGKGPHRYTPGGPDDPHDRE